MSKSRAVCECTGCGQFFKTEVSFNKHRTGSFGRPITASNGVTRYEKHSRRCLTVDEMKAVGLSLDDGKWTTAMAEEEKEEDTQNVWSAIV